jgi:hypothetical protein
VINCRDAQWLARQLRPQHRALRGTVGAAVERHKEIYALQRDQRDANSKTAT